MDIRMLSRLADLRCEVSWIVAALESASPRLQRQLQDTTMDL